MIGRIFVEGTVLTAGANVRIDYYVHKALYLVLCAFLLFEERSVRLRPGLRIKRRRIVRAPPFDVEARRVFLLHVLSLG